MNKNDLKLCQYLFGQWHMAWAVFFCFKIIQNGTNSKQIASGFFFIWTNGLLDADAWAGLQDFENELLRSESVLVSE